MRHAPFVLTSTTSSIQIVALSPRRLTADSELWLVVECLFTLILVWAGGHTNKKPKSNVFETKGCGQMMCTDQNHKMCLKHGWRQTLVRNKEPQTKRV